MPFQGRTRNDGLLFEESPSHGSAGYTQLLPTKLREQGTPTLEKKNHYSWKHKKLRHRTGFSKRLSGKASLLLSLRPWGSVALEAAFVLPLALFFLLTLFSFFTMIGIQVKVQEAIEKSLHYVEAVSAAQIASDTVEDLVSVGMMEGIVRNELSHYENVSWVTLLGTDIDREDNVVTLRVSYTVKAPTALIPSPSIRLSQSGSRHLWTGIGPAEEGEDGADVVYVTENGTVYHLSRDCRHLIQRTTAVSADQIHDLRSSDGSIYYPCHWCHPSSDQSTYYVTEFGNRYHSSCQCSQLRISVRAVSLSEVEGMRCCATCAAALGQ